jgi:methoxymalonate biosynthesis acyl carrier protein
MLPQNQRERESAIRTFLATASGRTSFTDTDDLMRLGILDSLQIMELISFLEEQFGILIDPEHMTTDNFSTIQHISALVQRLIDEPAR